MSQQNSVQAQIMAKAMKEETFRQELLSNPKAAIERELGITVPQGVTITVHQDTPTSVHLALPVRAPREGGEELSNAELEQATGGVMSFGGYICWK
jgi:hypothetical protein